MKRLESSSAKVLRHSCLHDSNQTEFDVLLSVADLQSPLKWASAMSHEIGQLLHGVASVLIPSTILLFVQCFA